MKMSKFTKTKLNNKGMTMVEIMVGFVLLGIFLGGLTQLIMFSSHMIQNSVDLRHAQTEVWSEAYRDNPGTVEGGISFTIKENSDGAEVIPLNTFELRRVEQSDDIDGIKVKMYIYSSTE